jgi:hypothetical protein
MTVMLYFQFRCQSAHLVHMVLRVACQQTAAVLQLGIELFGENWDVAESSSSTHGPEIPGLPGQELHATLSKSWLETNPSAAVSADCLQPDGSGVSVSDEDSHNDVNDQAPVSSSQSSESHQVICNSVPSEHTALNMPAYEPQEGSQDKGCAGEINSEVADLK